MANIAISELTSETTSLGDNDLLLVSKNNGTSYTSAKMKGSVLKNGVSDCQFSEDAVKNALTTYGATKSTDLSKLSTLTASDIKTQCQSAITSSAIAVNTNNFITCDVSKFITLKYNTYTKLEYDSYVLFSMTGNADTYSSGILYGMYGDKVMKICKLFTTSTSLSSNDVTNFLLPMRNGISIKYTIEGTDESLYSCTIMPCI